jgi:protein-arginine kinase activator protein McsA
VALRREIQKLHEDMQKAIEHEEFETAARLRDRIRSIETQGGTEPSDGSLPAGEESR